jgi:hypothetical protein
MFNVQITSGTGGSTVTVPFNSLGDAFDAISVIRESPTVDATLLDGAMEVLSNGRILLERAQGHVLAYDQDKHEWAIWREFRDLGDKFCYECGEYFNTYSQAVGLFSIYQYE